MNKIAMLLHNAAIAAKRAGDYTYCDAMREGRNEIERLERVAEATARPALSPSQAEAMEALSMIHGIDFDSYLREYNTLKAFIESHGEATPTACQIAAIESLEDDIRKRFRIASNMTAEDKAVATAFWAMRRILSEQSGNPGELAGVPTDEEITQYSDTHMLHDTVRWAISRCRPSVPCGPTAEEAYNVATAGSTFPSKTDDDHSLHAFAAWYNARIASRDEVERPLRERIAGLEETNRNNVMCADEQLAAKERQTAELKTANDDLQLDNSKYTVAKMATDAEITDLQAEVERVKDERSVAFKSADALGEENERLVQQLAAARANAIEEAIAAVQAMKGNWKSFSMHDELLGEVLRRLREVVEQKPVGGDTADCVASPTVESQDVPSTVSEWPKWYAYIGHDVGGIRFLRFDSE